MRARGDATQFGRHRRGTGRATGDDSEEEEQGAAEVYFAAAT